jgi:hypothetical protein
MLVGLSLLVGAFSLYGLGQVMKEEKIKRLLEKS